MRQTRQPLKTLKLVRTQLRLQGRWQVGFVVRRLSQALHMVDPFLRQLGLGLFREVCDRMRRQWIQPSTTILPNRSECIQFLQALTELACQGHELPIFQFNKAAKRVILI